MKYFAKSEYIDIKRENKFICIEPCQLMYIMKTKLE